MSRKLTRILALVISVVLTATLFSACGSGNEEPAVKDSSSAASASVAQGEPEMEPLALRYFHYWENKGQIDPKLDMVAPLIKEKFNITFKEIINPTQSGDEKFKLMITSGDIPDIMYLPFSQLSGSNKYATDGLFLELTQLVDKYPNLKKLYSPYMSRTLAATDKKIYSLPAGAWETAKDTTYNKEGMWIRKSVLDKLGMKQTDLKTPDDLFNLCMKIKTEFPDMIPYGLGGEGWGDSKFFLMYGADWHNLMPDDKSITFLPTHPGAKDGLRMIYKMMKNGLIEKDAFIQKDAQWREKLAQGKYAMIMHAPTIVYDDLGPLFQKNNPNDEYVPLSFPWAVQPHTYFRYPSNPDSITVFSAKIKNPEQVLAMCDWTASDEAYLPVTSGKEGEFYTIQDGKGVLTEKGILAKNDGKLRESMGLNGWYRFAGFGDTWKKFGGLDEEYAKVKEASAIMATYQQKDDGTSLFPNPDTTVAPQVPFRDEGWGILFKIWKDAQMKAIYAKDEDEAMKIWDRAVQDMQKQAGERMSKEFEAEYQKQLEILKNDTVSQEAAKELAAK